LKTKETILKQYFLNIKDISELFGISRKKAKKVYDLANILDDELFKEYRIEERKVTMNSTCKVMKTTLQGIKKRIA
jgi:hypothetical protein